MWFPFGVSRFWSFIGVRCDLSHEFGDGDSGWGTPLGAHVAARPISGLGLGFRDVGFIGFRVQRTNQPPQSQIPWPVTSPPDGCPTLNTLRSLDLETTTWRLMVLLFQLELNLEPT